MATLNPVVHSVCVKDAGSVDSLQTCEVLWTVTGTYDGSATPPIDFTGVDTLIEDSVRNGKAVTLVDVCRGQRANKESDLSAFMSTKAVTLAGSDIESDITDGDETTELADGAIPAQSRPFSYIVRFTEA